MWIDFGRMRVREWCSESFASHCLDTKYSFPLLQVELEELRHAAADLAVTEIGAIRAPLRFVILRMNINEVAHRIIRRKISRIRKTIFETRRLATVGTGIATLNAAHDYSTMNSA